MVVDDSEATLTAICDYLDELPVVEVVGTARDGCEAVEKVGLLRPDLVLMDFQMPRMNGLEATRKIKRSKAPTKILIVTIHDGPHLREALMSNGADGFLNKVRLRQMLESELSRLFPRKDRG